MPFPVAAAWLAKPALVHAATICSQGRVVRAEVASGVAVVWGGVCGLGAGDAAAVIDGWLGAGAAGVAVLGADVVGAGALGIGLGFLIAAAAGFADVVCDDVSGDGGGAAGLGAGAVLPSVVGAEVVGALVAGLGWVPDALAAGAVTVCFSRDAK
jgi:hypothetical protein